MKSTQPIIESEADYVEEYTLDNKLFSTEAVTKKKQRPECHFC